MGASSHVPCVVLLIAACMVQAHAGAASGVPSDWAEAVAQGDMLFAATDPAPGYFPYVGNGYVATELFTNTTYLAGVFNGISNSTPSHRAAVPSTVRVHLPGGSNRQAGAALDLVHAAFYNRTVITVGDCAGFTVQQTWCV